ncbi:MAG: hypothetical protein VXZ63_04760, partial [Planctomycetota bacterium]|nr:hypothetical protein [Planctomycetota bacterium]
MPPSYHASNAPPRVTSSGNLPTNADHPAATLLEDDMQRILSLGLTMALTLFLADTTSVAQDLTA